MGLQKKSNRGPIRIPIQTGVELENEEEQEMDTVIHANNDIPSENHASISPSEERVLAETVAEAVFQNDEEDKSSSDSVSAPNEEEVQVETVEEENLQSDDEDNASWEDVDSHNI